MTVLDMQAAEPMADMLDRARVVMESLEAGLELTEPYFGIGLEWMPLVLAVFTSKRSALFAYLREHGPLTGAVSARLGPRLQECPRRPGHADGMDCGGAGVDGRVCAPWDEIDLRLSLARRVD